MEVKPNKHARVLAFGNGKRRSGNLKKKKNVNVHGVGAKKEPRKEANRETHRCIGYGESVYKGEKSDNKRRVRED